MKVRDFAELLNSCHPEAEIMVEGGNDKDYDRTGKIKIISLQKEKEYLITDQDSSTWSQKGIT